MGSFGDVVETAVLAKLFNRTAWADYTIWVALSTADPSDSGANIAEPAGGGYGRQDASTSFWNAAANGAVDNALAIEFTTASASWGTITHFALYDASTAGNLLGYGTLTTPRDVTTGDAIRFAAGALDVALD